ncbi:hypothetical protein OIO90_006478 [Microbotryomycetes sp. JL221]|nr:hypothetical protein OIO90_006478 [Microbotryomycetes sp. JL221]
MTRTSLTRLAVCLSALTASVVVNAQDDGASLSNANTAPSSSQSWSSATASAQRPVSTGNTGSNPLIPTSVSTSCERFLTYLNGDKALAACTSSFASSLTLFAPTDSGMASYSQSATQVHDTLEEFCSAETCSDALIRTTLQHFTGNCSTELQDRQPIVLGTYDTLYATQPFRRAICAKDAEQGFCLEDIAKGEVPTGSSNASEALASSVSANLSAPALATTGINTTQAIVQLAVTKQYVIDWVTPSQLFVQFRSTARRLLRRQAWSSAAASGSATRTGSAPAAGPTASSAPSSDMFDLTGILPNADAWRSHALPFLFLSPNMSSSVLCTQCTKTILASYVAWESRIPYAIGLSNSPLLGQQGQLWTQIGDKCGGGFLASIASQAGQQSLTGGASQIAIKGGLALVAVAVGVAMCL